MKKLTPILIFLITLGTAYPEDQYVPSDVQRIIDVRNNEIKKIDEQYCAALQKLKVRYTQSGELDTALLVDSLLKEKENELKSTNRIITDRDIQLRINGTRWDFGTNRIITLNANGKIDKSWGRLHPIWKVENKRLHYEGKVFRFEDDYTRMIKVSGSEPELKEGKLIKKNQ